MMNEKKHGIGHNIRQAVLVTVVLLVLCGLVFPVLLSGLSAVIFPSQAKGSLVTADGTARGPKNVGQDFTEDYFMWCRPSAYNYNTYYEEDTDGDGQVEQYYNDGSEFAGLSSGSNNYAPSNPALTERVEADIEEFLEKNPGVSREDIPTDLMTASGSGLIPTSLPPLRRCRFPCIVEASGLSEDEVRQIIADNTKGKTLGVFGEETVNVLGVNLTSPWPWAWWARSLAITGPGCLLGQRTLVCSFILRKRWKSGMSRRSLLRMRPPAWLMICLAES